MVTKKATKKPVAAPATRQAFENIMPRFGELTRDVLFGDVWERPGLSQRDRSLITIAALTVLYRTDQLRGHIGRGLRNGLTKVEIAELIQHMAFYGGWPVAVNAFNVARDVFAENK
ncbi:MAG: carboxymuconolactone decarboxylase family protein [Chloroflexi bacterium]|nr:carboxymuconolactone decarboxylase family protein [Chloroflexota bacterium]